MPHEQHAYREQINALIGPIEELIARAEETLPMNVRMYVLGGLEQAKETLEDRVNEIDEYEEPEVEADEPDVEDDDADEDEDDEDEE